jgi:hypothetical protein
MTDPVRNPIHTFKHTNVTVDSRFSVKNILVEGCPFGLAPKHNKGLLVEVQHRTKSNESQFKSVKNWGNQLYMCCERYMGHKWRYCDAGGMRQKWERIATSQRSAVGSAEEKGSSAVCGW